MQVRRGLAALAATVLCACGGGGGGGPPPTALSLSTTAVDIRSPLQDAAPPPASVVGTITGEPGNVYLFIAYTNRGIASVTEPVILGASGTSEIHMRPPPQLGHGVFRDTVAVRACRDYECRQHYAGSPATIQVTYTIGIPSTPAALAIAGVEGQAAPAQALGLSYYGGSAAWSATPGYYTGSGWLAAQPASGATLPATTAVTAGALPPGTYGGSIDVAVGTQLNNVFVAYTVLPLLDIGAPAAFTVTGSQPAAGQVRRVAVASRVASRPSTWTAATAAPAPWLVLAQASGDTAAGDALRLQLDPDALLAMPNGSYAAEVVVTPAAAGASPVTVPVALTLDRPFVNAVAPYVVATGVPGRLVIRGEHLDAVGALSVTVGETTATDAARDHPTRVMASHAALPAGRHAVKILDGGVAIGSRAELVVRDAPDLSALGTSAPSPVGGVQIFDRERDACYFVSQEQGVAAIRRAGNAWQLQAPPQTFSFVFGATLADGGRDLLLMNGQEVIHLDPATLAVTARVALPPPPYGAVYGGGSFKGIDDGSALFGRTPGMLRYDPRRRSFSTIVDTGYYEPAQIMPSQAGNRVMWHQSFYSSSPYHRLDTTTYQSQVLARSEQFGNARADLFGDRWVFRNTITDALGNALGSVTTNYSWVRSLLRSDGQRLYVSQSHTTPCPSCSNYEPHITVYDLAPLATGGAPAAVATVRVWARELGAELGLGDAELVSCSPEGVSAIDAP